MGRLHLGESYLQLSRKRHKAIQRIQRGTLWVSSLKTPRNVLECQLVEGFRTGPLGRRRWVGNDLGTAGVRFWWFLTFI